MCNRSVVDGNCGIIIHVAILTTTIDRSMNCRCRRCARAIFSTYNNSSLPDIGQLGFLIALCGDVDGFCSNIFTCSYITSCSTKYATAFRVGNTYFGITFDGHRSQTAIRLSVCSFRINHLIGPAQSEVVECRCCIDISIVGSNVLVQIIAVFLFVEVIKIRNFTHRTHRTGTIDVMYHMTTIDG